MTTNPLTRSDDDHIDSNIIFNDPYMENNGGTSEHDSNAYDEYHDIQMLAYNVQRKAENQKRLNDELKKKKRCYKRILRRLRIKSKHLSKKQFNVQNIKKHVKSWNVKYLAKKDFKERENQYLDDICDLEEKLSSHYRIVLKIGESIQTIHMHGKQPNNVYDSFLKAGLGYKNPERLKKPIAAQPKMYHGEMLDSTNLKIDSPDSEETLEDAKESRLKMRNKMVQLNYEKLNALYETFVPQQEPFVEQTYFSFPSTSNDCSKSKEVTSDLPIPKCQKRVNC
ncbi:hypothetical protein Tco_1215219 [Tanacetum coccineum]